MKKKHEIFMCSLLEFKEIEKRLEKRAAEGWRLEKTGTFFWTYKEAEPKQVHYSIVFFPKTNALEPEPSDSLVMMREYCEQTGWKLVAEQGQMQIFCNEEESPVPIETEAWIQVKNIHETMKKGIVLTHNILLVNAVLQFALQVMQFFTNPIDWLSRGFGFYLTLTWIALGLGSGTEIIHYYLWHKKAKRIAEEEEILFLPKSMKGFRITYLAVAMVSLFLGVLALMDFTSIKYGWFVLIWTVVLIGVPLGVSRVLKKMKVSAKWNQIIIIILAIVASVGMTVALVVFVMKDADFITQKEKEMPLVLSDMREVDEDDLVESYRESNSIFLTYKEGYQREKWEKDENVEAYLMIDYTILVIKMPFIYDFCKEEMLDSYDKWDEQYPELQGYHGYKKCTNPAWDAIEVYQYYDYDNEPDNDYIVCYEDRIIQIDFGWDVTDEDIAKVRESIYNIP